MGLGAGIIGQTKLRPVRSAIPVANAGANVIGNGCGVSYGFGVGSVRIEGLTYCVWDPANAVNMAAENFFMRVAIINGDYPLSSQIFTPATDLTGYELLFDQVLSGADRNLPLWESGIVTDEGLRATVLASQLVFPAGAPALMTPQTILLLRADHYRSVELALSAGSTVEQI